MALLEALTLGIGASVAKATIKLWLGDSTLVSVSANSVVDVLKKYIEDFSARRTTERVFDDLRDEVARRLQPVIEVEFRDLAENDQVAAVYAVAQVFDGFSFDENLLKLDLDATRLETELNAPAEAAFRTLGDSPEKLAKLLLRECCNYVVRLAQAMPKVQAAATHEILKREREMMNVLTSMLDQLAAMRNTAANVGPAEAQSFELQYRRALVNKLDRLDLFGLRMIGGGAREYPLSVAYVRLSATHTGAGHSGRVDQILGQQQYVLIRGEAGSGKTTLMQWLAVRCASRELTGALQEWNDRIPYYVRLRDYARGVEVSFPTPEELLRGAGKNLASEQPHGWVHKALRANGLLLIDGVDELPAARRNAFGQWLRELRQDFSASAIVLSS